MDETENAEFKMQNAELKSTHETNTTHVRAVG